jgi:hypothetical protein
MARVRDQAATATEPGDLTQDRARRLDAAFRLGAGTFSILMLFVFWELLARSGRVTPFMLPPFTAVVERIYADAVSHSSIMAQPFPLPQGLVRKCLGDGLSSSDGEQSGGDKSPPRRRQRHDRAQRRRDC